MTMLRGLRVSLLLGAALAVWMAVTAGALFLVLTPVLGAFKDLDGVGTLVAAMALGGGTLGFVVGCVSGLVLRVPNRSTSPAAVGAAPASYARGNGCHPFLTALAVVSWPLRGSFDDSKLVTLIGSLLRIPRVTYSFSETIPGLISSVLRRLKDPGLVGIGVLLNQPKGGTPSLTPPGTGARLVVVTLFGWVGYFGALAAARRHFAAWAIDLFGSATVF